MLFWKYSPTRNMTFELVFDLKIKHLNLIVKNIYELHSIFCLFCMTLNDKQCNLKAQIQDEELIWMLVIYIGIGFKFMIRILNFKLYFRCIKFLVFWTSIVGCLTVTYFSDVAQILTQPNISWYHQSRS